MLFFVFMFYHKMIFQFLDKETSFVESLDGLFDREDTSLNVDIFSFVTRIHNILKTSYRSSTAQTIPRGCLYFDEECSKTSSVSQQQQHLVSEQSYSFLVECHLGNC